MPTGYTQQIIDGTVKTPKEFLHLCLRNFGVCVSMRDVPFNESQVDYTEYIKKYYQDSMVTTPRCWKMQKPNMRESLIFLMMIFMRCM